MQVPADQAIEGEIARADAQPAAADLPIKSEQDADGKFADLRVNPLRRGTLGERRRCGWCR
jgi:hypothetical protein